MLLYYRWYNVQSYCSVHYTSYTSFLSLMEQFDIKNHLFLLCKVECSCVPEFLARQEQPPPSSIAAAAFSSRTCATCCCLLYDEYVLPAAGPARRLFGRVVVGAGTSSSRSTTPRWCWTTLKEAFPWLFEASSAFLNKSKVRKEKN